VYFPKKKKKRKKEKEKQKESPPSPLPTLHCLVRKLVAVFEKNKNKRNFPNVSQPTFLSKIKLCDASEII
jgi:hypothetical protein